METVSMERTVDADPAQVRDIVTDVGPFIRACGFDDVTVDGSRVRIENSVGLATIELDLELVERDGCVLAYEQRDGIFEEMTTWYELDGDDGTTTLTATTEFALDVALVGMILDATVIKRQRRKELSAQFDWIAEAVSDSESGSSPS
jgi:hypothetical protein